MTSTIFSPANQTIIKKFNNISNPDQIPIIEEHGIATTSNGYKNILTKTYFLKNNLTKTITTIVDKPTIDKERTLFQTSFLFGSVGSTIHGLTSLVTWATRKRVSEPYFFWYFVKPFIGGTLAVIVYTIIRVGLLNGIPSIVEITGNKGIINIYGVTGLSAIVGLNAEQINKKLRGSFDAIFDLKKQKENSERTKDDNTSKSLTD